MVRKKTVVKKKTGERPIWRGHVSFGLVNIPVMLFSAEKRSDLHFNMIDSRNHARIRYERVNDVTGKEVPWNEIVKGYEYGDDQYVLLSDADFRKAAVEKVQAIAIEDFIERADIDSLYFDKPYYLVPDKGGDKGYVILREVLRRTSKVGIAKVTIRTREHLAALYDLGEMLVLMLLRFHQEIVDPKKYDVPSENLKANKVTSRELDVAEQLVESMTSKWKPVQYHDEYRDALMKWIEKKVKAGDLEAAPQSHDDEDGESGGEVIDIMDLLEKSVSKSAPKRKRARR